MTHHATKQARLDQIKHFVSQLNAEQVTEQQLAQITEILNVISVEIHQHYQPDNVTQVYFETENKVKKLQNDIAVLEQSDLFINNEAHHHQMQQALKITLQELQVMAEKIQNSPKELERFKHFNARLKASDHLPLTQQLFELA